MGPDPGGLIRLPATSEDEPPQVVDQDFYDRVAYGSGDDAVLSELFGLETPYSDPGLGRSIAYAGVTGRATALRAGTGLGRAR
jgi:hypothetical protein